MTMMMLTTTLIAVADYNSANDASHLISDNDADDDDIDRSC